MLRSSFSLSFLAFTCFPLQFFHLRVPMVFPCWHVHLLSIASPSVYGYISFICFGLTSAVSSLALFILPPWVNLLPASLPFPFPRLCAVLSCSLSVRSVCLSFFLGGFLMRFPDFASYFLVRSLRHRLLRFFGFVFLFYTFETLQYVCPTFFLVAVQPFSSHQLPHLFFGLLLVLLYCLCFSPVLSVSTPPTGFSFGCNGVGFCSWGCCGSYGSSCCFAFVLSFAATLSSAPPFRLLWLQLYPLYFFLIPRSWLLLPVFLCVFPHAAAPAAPSSLPQCFPLAAAAPCALWCGSCCLACCGLSGCGSSGFLFLRFPVFLLSLLVRTFTGFFNFSSLCFLRLRALPLCLLFLVLCWRFSLLRLLFLLSRCTFSLFECPCCFLWGFCLVRISGSLRNESGFAAPYVYLSSQACFWWSFPFLCGFPFCSSDSFASKVPFATWSPFGTSPTSFGVLSLSGFWFSPAVLPILLIQVAFALQSLPWYLSAVTDFGLCGVSSSLDALCLLFVFYTQFGVLSS